MKEDPSSLRTKTLRSYIFGSRSFTVTTDIDVLKWALFGIAVLSRFWKLDHPRAVVFDEMFYGRFASMYLKNTFYFDKHPPLGKMLIALAGYLGNFDGKASFDRIGTEYPPSVPLWCLRAVPALSGSLLVLLTYQLVTELGYRPWTAGLTSCLIILDNALLTQSRYILMELPLMLFTTVSLLSYVKFKQSQNSPYSIQWWIWLTLLGTSISITVSIKYSGVLSVILLLVLVGRDFWNMLPCSTLTNTQLWREFLSQCLCLVVLPVLFYVLVFYIHLTVLYKSGPHDDIMTSSFQATLQGGLSSVTKHQPVTVAYGSQITLRHTYDSQPCWLHSHHAVYPLRYSPTRGSSHQQQVTCYSFKDANNWWIIKHPSRNKLTVDDPIKPVKHGDVIQLIHGITSRALNSHDVAAPMNPQFQEVSCYIDYNISFPAQNLWRVEIVNPGSDQIWRTIESHIRLVHLNTSTALKTTGRQLPEWGFHQFEVVADKNKDQMSSIWNVEEHKYTRLQDNEAMENELTNTSSTPTKLTAMSFWAKFFELQLRMFLSNEPEIDHRYSSDPTSWPLIEKNIAYWYNPYNNAQIHLLGNLALWISVTVCLLVYSGLMIFYMVRRQRACFDIEQEEWLKLKEVGWLFFAGYLFNYLPYFMTDQSLFLYHYLPALFFGILLTSTLIHHIHNITECLPYIQPVLEMLLLVWITCLFMTHIKLLVFSYGLTPMTPDDIKHLSWRDTWDFLSNAH